MGGRALPQLRGSRNGDGQEDWGIDGSECVATGKLAQANWSPMARFGVHDVGGYRIGKTASLGADRIILVRENDP